MSCGSELPTRMSGHSFLMYLSLSRDFPIVISYIILESMMMIQQGAIRNMFAHFLNCWHHGSLGLLQYMVSSQIHIKLKNLTHNYFSFVNLNHFEYNHLCKISKQWD